MFSSEFLRRRAAGFRLRGLYRPLLACKISGGNFETAAGKKYFSCLDFYCMAF